METLIVKRGEVSYLLFNLTDGNVSELQRDPQKLTIYLNNCIQTGSNVCMLENEGNSSAPAESGLRYSNTPCNSAPSNAPQSSAFSNAPCSSTSSAASGQRKEKFTFLCRTYERRNLIIGVKFANHPWHYFDELDTLSSEHGSLPASMDSLISRLDKVRPIYLNLDEEQSRHYFNNGKFIFKNKELKTYMELANIANKQSGQSSALKSTHKSTKQLLFVSGQTNPLLFLNEFEKCRDLKTDKDKMFKIRHFVDECDNAEFTKLYFTSDWPTVRSAFLKMYSFTFAENKKKELQIDFNTASSLRTFVERKLESFAKSTTLPFLNQMEMVLNALPAEISTLFITNEMLTNNKNEILVFCDSIQELVETIRGTTEETDEQESNQPLTEPSNQMEIFDYEPQCESESMCFDYSPGTSRRGGRGRTRGALVKRGRPSKKIKTIPENSESSYDFLKQMDNTSRSSWSSN